MRKPFFRRKADPEYLEFPLFLAGLLGTVAFLCVSFFRYLRAL